MRRFDPTPYYRQAIVFLNAAQLPDGSWHEDRYVKGYIEEIESNVGLDFFHTTFISSLLPPEDTQHVQQKALRFVRQYQRPGHTWNFRKNSLTSPYPDDLDDTACALLCYSNQGRGGLTVDAKIALTHILLANQQTPGGPYRTWIAPPKDERWSDVDYAVNANVYHLLKSLRISLGPLESYLQSNYERASSNYYIHTSFIQFLYARSAPISFIAKARHATNDGNDFLNVCLRVLVARRLQDEREYHHTAKLLCRLQHHDGSWPATPIYIGDPINHSKTETRVGSAALSTAIALCSLGSMPTKHTSLASQHHIQKSRNYIIPNVSLQTQRDYKTLLRPYTDSSNQNVSGAATLINSAFRLGVDTSEIQKLDHAHSNGWLAYSLFDDAADDLRVHTLPVANIASRISQQNYLSFAAAHDIPPRIVYDHFNIMDDANAWELSYARHVIDGTYTHLQLPDYGDLSQLAHRSWGAVVVGSLLLYGTEHANAYARFFRHYFIVRQLFDDMHDFMEDLQKGHLSYVVSELLRACQTNDIDIFDAQAVQATYWQVCLRPLLKKCEQHTLLAEIAAKTTPSISQLTLFDPLLHTVNDKRHQAEETHMNIQRLIDSLKP